MITLAALDSLAQQQPPKSNMSSKTQLHDVKLGFDLRVSFMQIPTGTQAFYSQLFDAPRDS